MRRISSVFISIIITFLLCSNIYAEVSQDNMSATELVELGKSLMSEDKIEDAIDALNRAININPDPETYFIRGVAYGNQGKHEKAINDFSFSIEKKADNAIGFASRGIAYRHINENKKALNDFNRDIELNSKEPSFYMLRGIAYYYLNENEAAEKDLSMAISMDSENANYYFNRAAYYHLRKIYDKALDDYNKTILIDEKNNIASYNLAVIYAIKKDAANSCKWLKYAIGKGYDDRKGIIKDNDLAKIRGKKCYKEIMTNAFPEKYGREEADSLSVETKIGCQLTVIGNKDSKLYHMPGMKYYNRILPNHRVEFCAEEDAIRAGYHKAPR